MPFVTTSHRETPDLTIPGDRCYMEYKRIMKTWSEQPRWTTIDKIAVRLFPDDNDRAFFLAFLVFMAFHGMNYETVKREENGDITGAEA